MRARSSTITIAAVLLGLFSLVNLVPLAVEGVPVFVVYLSIVLGVVGLVAAVGLWLLKRWSIWLTIIVCALNILSAAPGIAFAPTAALQGAAAIGVLVAALIIVLVGLPTSRRAFAATRVS